MNGQIKAVLLHTPSDRTFSDPVVRETLQRIASLYPGAPIFSNIRGLPVEILTGTPVSCACEALEKTGSAKEDSIALFQGMAPLLDPVLAGEAFDQHKRYFAHYTWGEDISSGLLPDFASREFVEMLKGTERESLPDIRALRDHVYKNINEYDAEIFYRSPDLRRFRLDFTCESDRSESIALAFLSEKRDLAFDGLDNFLLDHPGLYRPFPTYVEMEMTTAADVRPVFMPAPPGNSLHLSSDALDRIISDIAGSPFRNDLTIAMGGMGDPLLHPQFIMTVERLAALDPVKRIYIETFATRIDPSLIERVSAIPNAQKIEWIVRLTTLRKDRYRNLYGADRIDSVLEALALLENAVQKGAPFRLYAEMLKIRDVEDEIEEYFNRFEKTPFQVILQKFNRYVDLLEERRVSDLTPLHRDFCWHLARDLYVTASGRVPVCRQDPFAERAISFDIVKDGIAGIYEKTEEYHLRSVRSEHDRIPMPCLRCDEWYTFNG